MAFTEDEIWGCELVQKQVQVACEGAAKEAFEHARDILTIRHVLSRGCESPIEAVFATWWMALADNVMHHRFQEPWTLHAQEEVAVGGVAYRVDFEVAPVSEDHYEPLRSFGYTRPRIAIELDGHDFHERTKEQVAHRNARDRALQQAGWRMLHYSGSELVRDPGAAVFQVLDACFKVWDEAWDVKDRNGIRPVFRKRSHGTNQDDQA
jgi:hypothetical protein